jgi:hypothetical protein
MRKALNQLGSPRSAGSIRNYLFIFIALYSLFPSPVFAQEDQGIFDTNNPYGPVVSFKWLETLVENLLKAILPLIGIASFIMIIFGAFSFLTAGDNQESLQKAKSTLTYGIIGLFAALLVWFAFYFISQFTGLRTQLLEFNLDF